MVYAWSSFLDVWIGGLVHGGFGINSTARGASIKPYAAIITKGSTFCEERLGVVIEYVVKSNKAVCCFTSRRGYQDSLVFFR
jgi:hypothetical protein